MNQHALQTVFIDEVQTMAAIRGQIAPYCKQKWAEGHARLSVLIQPEEDQRSIQQNRFYWGPCLKNISEQAAVGGQKYSKDAWHELFKRQFLPRKVSKSKVAGRKKTVVSVSIGSTRDLSVQKMSKYLEKLQAFAATDLGVAFSCPNWESYRA